MKKKNAAVEFIAAHAYPQMLRPREAREFLDILLSDCTTARTAKAIEIRAADLRSAVIGYVQALQQAFSARDFEEVFAEAHEIRGLAETIGLPASGRIANGLCNYIDALVRAGVPPDAVIVGLHVEAIARAALATDEATRLGDVVANELYSLVTRRIGGSGARH